MEQEPAQVDAFKLPLYNAEQNRIGEFEGLSKVFAHQGSAATLYEAVLMQRANRRAGTAATKSRGMVSGGGIKPWRQKGTGRARAGSTRSPLWRHGGTIFGPHPRDYSYALPRKQRAKALRLALCGRAQEGKLLVIERLELERPKTKLAKALLDKLELSRTLVVVGEGEEGFIRAARNLARHKVLRVGVINAYDVLNFVEVLFTVKAAREIEARFREAD